MSAKCNIRACVCVCVIPKKKKLHRFFDIKDFAIKFRFHHDAGKTAMNHIQRHFEWCLDPYSATSIAITDFSSFCFIFLYHIMNLLSPTMLVFKREEDEPAQCQRWKKKNWEEWIQFPICHRTNLWCVILFIHWRHCCLWILSLYTTDTMCVSMPANHIWSDS